MGHGVFVISCILMQNSFLEGFASTCIIVVGTLIKFCNACTKMKRFSCVELCHRCLSKECVNLGSGMINWKWVCLTAVSQNYNNLITDYCMCDIGTLSRSYRWRRRYRSDIGTIAKCRRLRFDHSWFWIPNRRLQRLITVLLLQRIIIFNATFVQSMFATMF